MTVCLMIPSLRRLPAACLLVLALASLAWPAEVFFSPDGGARQRLIRAIQESRTSIDIAVYSFNSLDLAESLFAARDRGVRVRLILDRGEYRTGGAAARAIQKNNLPMRLLGMRDQSLMHDKFAVFDNRLVATGSYNWTGAAEYTNHENLVLLDDRDLVERFQREFERLWHQAERGGSQARVPSPPPHSASWGR